MPKIAYIDKRFRSATLEVIDTANGIITEYSAQGYDLTLRQLYYQMVSRDIIPNSQKEYDKLGRTISDARMAGLIDWDAIVDRTRGLKGNSHWTSPQSIMNSVARGYRIDKWKEQPNRVEVWIEKDALVGVISGICQQLDIDYFSCRGYTSQSEMWTAGQRLERYIKAGQRPVILHLGDHDPSGIDMTRDVTDRLALFMGGTKVQRIALNYDQVEQYSPPPNPAKTTDTRAADYIELHGHSSWELDALDPATISQLIEGTVIQFRDDGLWNAAAKREAEQKELLEQASNDWDDVVDMLRGQS